VKVHGGTTKEDIQRGENKAKKAKLSKLETKPLKYASAPRVSYQSFRRPVRVMYVKLSGLRN
jgi:hypothetical protein